MDDSVDLFGHIDDASDASDASDVGSWTLVEPTPKSKPLPPTRHVHSSPRIRAPFQVTDLSASSKPAPVVGLQIGTVVQPGLARPTMSAHGFISSFI